MIKRCVVISGLGIVAPNGIGKEAFWQANVNGISGVSVLRHFDTSALSSKIAASIYDFDLAQFMAPSVVRTRLVSLELGVILCCHSTYRRANNMSRKDGRVLRGFYGVLCGSNNAGSSAVQRAYQALTSVTSTMASRAW